MPNADSTTNVAERIDTFLSDKATLRKVSLWIVAVIATCVLVFLGVRYIGAITEAVAWLFELFLPLIIGVVLALIINVPMSVLEPCLFPSKATFKARRPLAILLSLLLVFGVITLVILLVVPEFIRALVALGEEAVQLFTLIADSSQDIQWDLIPFGAYLSQLNIDWALVGEWLEGIAAEISGLINESVLSTVKSTGGVLANVSIGLVFAIYVLQSKEKLKRLAKRLIDAWLPAKMGGGIVHVASVCATSFRLFIVGQTTEAIILGGLCTVGMLILQMPYAPMIGALICVTALVPYVGGLVGGALGAVLIFTVDPFKALAFVVFLVVLQQVEGNLIYPRVMGSKINLPSIWVFAAVTVGGKLAGPLGMLLSIPLASSAYALLKEETEKRERKKLQQV